MHNELAGAEAQISTWALIRGERIHTDGGRQLALFTSREAAIKWLSKFGLPDCQIKPVLIELKNAESV